MTTENKSKKPDVEILDERSQQALSDQELAMANLARIMEQRKESPDGVFVSNVIENERKYLEKTYVLDKYPEHMMGSTVNEPARHQRMISKGWIPILEERNGKKIHLTDSHGDLLYHRPKILTHEELVYAGKTSKAQLEGIDGMMRENTPSDMLLENKTTVIKGKLE